jgi:hypothetical protein
MLPAPSCLLWRGFRGSETAVRLLRSNGCAQVESADRSGKEDLNGRLPLSMAEAISNRVRSEYRRLGDSRVEQIHVLSIDNPDHGVKPGTGTWPGGNYRQQQYVNAIP